MEVYTVPESRRYWVIRADGGEYFEHFIDNEVIALGHLDGLNLDESIEQPFEPNYDIIEHKLSKLHESQGHDKGRTTTHIKQVKAFLSEIQVGDWVLTVGNYSYRFGRVTGLPRLSKKLLKVKTEQSSRRNTHLKYHLRRQVVWGPSIKRTVLPYGLRTSLRAHQTLFNIDDHSAAVYHSLYPLFIKNNNLHLSARINTEDNVKNYAVVSLLSFLDEIEVISKEFENELNEENFDVRFNQYALNGSLTITTQAAFHSPGDVWNTLFSGNINIHLDSWVIYAAISYSMIFGNKGPGFDGLLDLKTRQKLWDLVIDRMNKKNIPSVVKTLDLTTPMANTKKLENKNKDEVVDREDS